MTKHEELAQAIFAEYLKSLGYYDSNWERLEDEYQKAWLETADVAFLMCEKQFKDQISKMEKETEDLRTHLFNVIMDAANTLGITMTIKEDDE